MNFKKIVFFHQDILFEIFDEIKEKLSFELIKADQKIFDTLSEKSDVNYLFIVKSQNHKLKNYLLVDKFPVKIDKLIEQINLKFLKENFNYQSKITVGNYNLNLNSREITRENKNMDLTEREINLILFLKNSKLPVKIEKLEKEVWDYGSELETHTVETHIHRLRKKIKENFNDDEFIISSKEGYILN